MQDDVVADRYRLGTPLGHGALANVYRAFDLRLNRDVAIKLFHPGQDAAVRVRFGAEAQALARLSHPGLIGIYDAGVDDDRPYLVMELVDGESLRDLLLAGPLPPAEVMALGARLAAALAHVHASDVVHRDIKPSNIVLDAQAQPHLADFGIALLLDAARMTGSNEILGTAAYLAPEQILGDPVGAPADVYSLGLVLLECLTGELEYPGVSKVESALARLHRPPRIPADLPPALAELLTAMTARCPTDRPTAAECAIGLSGARLPRRHRGTAVLVGWRRFAIAGSSLAIAIIASAWMLTSLLPRFSPSMASPGSSTRQYGTTDRAPAVPPPDPRYVAAPMAAQGPAVGVARRTTSTDPADDPTDPAVISTQDAPSPAPTTDTSNAPLAFGPSQSATPTTTPPQTTTAGPPSRHRSPPRTIPRRFRPTTTPNPR